MLATTPSFSGELLFHQGEFAGHRYRYEASVCQNPTCKCEQVSLKCFTDIGEAGSDSPVCLEMDLRRREIANFKKLEADPATQALANAVVAETGQEEWEQFGRIYWELKQYWTEHSDLDEVEVSFPPDVLSGTMVGYYEIFPFARRLEFTHGQETWLVDDQYCCNPKCPCEEAALSFLRLSAEPARRDPLLPSLTVGYRYAQGKISRLESQEEPQYSAQGLLESLKRARADLDSVLADRHSLLRRLVRRSLKIQTNHSRTPKIGRNDPCPCGSGKKWKRCCGAAA